jgi:hypothetical protein
MYLPWSVNLTSYFYKNVEDLKSVIKQDVLKNERVIVFFSTSSTEAVLYELKYKNGDCVEVPLKNYINPPFTTPEGITSILNDVKHYTPASRYGMVIGCHGMGWLPVEKTASRSAADQKYHWEYEGGALTRFFGGTSPEYQTEITDLAKGIANAGIKMEYILFDDCYMSSIETAFDLKDVTDYVIASPTEIMAYGMPYAKMGQHLIGDVNYNGICEEFYQFYSNYLYPYGTISVTKCPELNELAAVMKEINSRFTFDASLIGNLQRMDGYSPVIFFDYGDYISKLCTDKELLERFEAQLERTVPPQYRRHTTRYYSNSRGPIKINTYSGTTISDPSANPKATKKTETAWYKATHAAILKD